MKKLSPKVIEKLKRLGVAVVYLYGSRAIGRPTRFSDLDVGIVLKDRRLLQQRARRTHLYLRLFECLTPALVRDLSQEIDLVLLQGASPVLQFEAINAGCPLFVADPVFRADYEATVIRDYLDVRPLVEAHYQTAMDRAA